ncbi:MAG: histidinol-phosphate transaminase [Candidatus Latescibacterota bacterium]|nr:histidinol-phosphate transaminase [Candidatus Latescibacterota bacterium]
MAETRNDSSSPPPPLSHIGEMTGYAPGEQPKSRPFIKLNTNENPYPPSPKVLERLATACDDGLRRYPDADATGVRQRLSTLFDLPAESFIVGNGSDELLNVLLRCYAGRGDAVVYPTPTYPYYAKLIALQDARPMEVALDDDFFVDVDALASIADARVTLLANPNSPSGVALSSGAVEQLAQATKGILVVDEAYVDFAREGAMDLVRRFANVVVMRTLSKSFSLAGMRVGFCASHPQVATTLCKVKEHYNISALSQVAAEAALDDVDWMSCNAERVVETRKSLTESLRQRDFHVWESAANFVLTRVPAGRSAQNLYTGLRQHGILVRYFGKTSSRLAGCLRISIGSDEENEALIQGIDRLLCD